MIIYDHSFSILRQIGVSCLGMIRSRQETDIKMLLDMLAANLEMKWTANGIHITIIYSLPANANVTVRELVT